MEMSDCHRPELTRNLKQTSFAAIEGNLILIDWRSPSDVSNKTDSVGNAYKQYLSPIEVGK